MHISTYMHILIEYPSGLLSIKVALGLSSIKWALLFLK